MLYKMEIKRILLAVLLLSLFTTIPSAAESDKTSLNAEFIKVYKQYQTSMKGKDSADALSLAEKALSLGTKLYGPHHETTAVLTYNYAQVYFINQTKISVTSREYIESINLFNQALDLYEKIYNENAPELIDPLMSLADVYLKKRRKPKLAAKYYNRAIRIAEQNKTTMPLLYVDLSLEVGKDLLDSHHIRKSKRYLETAYNQYRKLLPENDARVALSTFWLAKYNYFNQDYKDAEPLFLEVVDIYNKAGVSGGQIALTSNAFLVRVYEKMGLSDKATAHCKAIGKAKPWDGDREQTPIFILEPRWPMSALRSGQTGFVRVGFTISEDGFVEDPEVKDHQGHEKFKKSALDALTKWRFAPKFVDGKAVASKVYYTMEFKLE